MIPNDPIPPAPTEMTLASRLAWRAGYRQALEDLLNLKAGGVVAIIGAGGEITMSDIIERKEEEE